MLVYKGKTGLLSIIRSHLARGDGQMDERIEQIKIGLCDDESHVHETVTKSIEDYQKDRKCRIELVHFYSAGELLESGENIPILLLDIDMPQTDGIEAAYRLREQGRECRIIMLTSKRERFKDAFKIGAYRFVTKPVDTDELWEALDDARDTLLGYAQAELRFGRTVCMVRQYQIDYLQACGDYVKVYVGEKVCESTKSLKNWKEELDGRLFIDCHKSYIINLRRIRKVGKDMIFLENGEEIPIARRRRHDVMQAFMAFDTGKGRGE